MNTSTTTISTKCEHCGEPVPADSSNRPRRFHPECRKLWRSEQMQGNANAVGRRTTKLVRAQSSDPVAAAAYAEVDLQLVQSAATAYWGEHGEFALWVYHAVNSLFDIPVPLIQFCRVMPYGKCVGVSHTSDVNRPVIDVFESLWRCDLPYAQVAGVIIHEMQHFAVQREWIRRQRIWHRTSHDNELWHSGCERLSDILLADLSLDDEPFERWPHAHWSIDAKQYINDSLSRRVNPFV